MACTCSPRQLYLVGCDCRATREAVIVKVWKDGYPSDNRGTLYVEGGDNIDAAVANAFGATAKVYATTTADRQPTAQASANHAFAMRGDNS